MPARKRKYRAGRNVKPSGPASGVYGSTKPSATISNVVEVSGRLGRLRNGLPAVRMLNRTSVWVASYSTNQPVWKSVAPAWKTCNMMKKIRKSKIELTGPMKSIKRRMSLISHDDQ